MKRVTTKNTKRTANAGSLRLLFWRVIVHLQKFGVYSWNFVCFVVSDVMYGKKTEVRSIR